MAKKSKSSFSTASLYRGLAVVVFLLLVWVIWEKGEDVQESISQYIENGDLLTFESKYTPEEIMATQHIELIGATQKSFREPQLRYYPYLLMDVKFTENKKSKSGIVLWGLADGEIVLDSETWEITDGYKDCLDCKAKRSDFLIIHALMKHQGVMTLETLQKELNVEKETLERWLAWAIEKHLVIKKGNIIQLHFESPKIIAMPQTKMKQKLVSRPVEYSERVGKSYSKSQVGLIAQAAFGSDFIVRSSKEVYLPVYRLEVENPDGSIHVTEWNAVTGRIKN